MGSLANFHRKLVLKGPQGLVESLLFFVLVLVSWAFCLLTLCRDRFYSTRLFPTYRSVLPVISVGNLTVGGTGKTPFVDFLVQWFENHGVRVAVISRGYGGLFSGRLATVSAGDGPLLTPSVCGDEPYLLALKHPRSKVYIAPRRRDALEYLDHQGIADLAVLDDAFQHRQVARDLDIVLLDAERPYGNGYLLPAGTLREKPSALERADLLVATRANRRDDKQPFPAGRPLCRCTHRLDNEVLTLQGVPIDLQRLSGQKGLAFAGIATPDQFFEALKDAGLTLLATRAFPDHTTYGHEQVEILKKDAAAADYLITTEKDAVKLSGLNFDKPCYVTQLKLDFLEDEALVSRLEGILNRIKNEQCH